MTAGVGLWNEGGVTGAVARCIAPELKWLWLLGSGEILKVILGCGAGGGGWLEVRETELGCLLSRGGSAGCGFFGCALL